MPRRPRAHMNRLLALARRRLGDLPRRAVDEEDVVQSAFNSFFVRIQQGRFPELRDRDNLWPLLVKITGRKALDVRDREQAAKRGAGRVKGESAFLQPNADEAVRGIEQHVGQEPSPEFACEILERMDHLLALLPDETLQRIACRKLDGFTNADIAHELGRVESTIERKLARIRAIWAKELDG